MVPGRTGGAPSGEGRNMTGIRRQILIACVATATALGGVIPVAGDANAVIGSTSGAMVLVSPPASTMPGAFDSLTSIFAFNERQNVTLASSLVVDITTPGSYGVGGVAGTNQVALPSGTVVDSHLIHNDNRTGGAVFRSGTITFPTEIVGVIVNHTRLTASDILGAPGTVYPAGNNNRGMEFQVTSGDIVILPDMRTVRVDLNTTSAVDQVRILTKHNSPPVANAGGPYAALEGSPVTLAGSATDTDADALTKSWAFTWTGSAGTSCQRDRHHDAHPGRDLYRQRTRDRHALGERRGQHAGDIGGQRHRRQCRAHAREPDGAGYTDCARSLASGQRPVHRRRNERHPHRHDHLGRHDVLRRFDLRGFRERDRVGRAHLRRAGAVHRHRHRRRRRSRHGFGK